MAYGDVKRQVEGIIASHPAGLTTQNVYEVAKAYTVGDQSHIRTALRKLANSKAVLRAPQLSRGAAGKVGRTFRYFPVTEQGRSNHASFIANGHGNLPRKLGGIPQARSPGFRATEQSLTRRASRGELAKRVIEELKNANGGLLATRIAELCGIPPQSASHVRRVLQELSDTGAILRVRHGRSSTKGGAPFVYFPKTAFGRQKLRELKTGIPTSTTATTYTSELAPAPQPRQYHAGNGHAIEVVVKVSLPDGTHEVPVDFARQMKDELVGFFG